MRLTEEWRCLKLSWTQPLATCFNCTCFARGFGAETSGDPFYLPVALGVTVQIHFIQFCHIFAFVSSTGTGKSSESPKTFGMKYSGRFLSQKPEEFQTGRLLSSSKTQTNLYSYTVALCPSVSELTFSMAHQLY